MGRLRAWPLLVAVVLAACDAGGTGASAPAGPVRPVVPGSPQDAEAEAVPTRTPVVADAPRCPASDRAPDSAVAAARHWGLFCTDAELVIWRERADDGPYRSDGDAGAHTPGDWDRISDAAATFVADPDEAHWTGPDQGGEDDCVEKRDDAPPVGEASALRDAAFAALVTADEDMAETVRGALLAQAREPGVDYTDDDRWCPGVLDDWSPSFPMAHWLTKLLLAYDYLGPEVFEEDEIAELDAWFRAGATFLLHDLEAALDSLYVDRDGGDLRLAEEDPNCDRTSFYGSPPNCLVHRYYNNRRGAIVRYIGLVGLHQGDAELRDAAHRYVEEFLRFGVFPGGFLGDFERWTEERPDLGWAYAAQALGSAVVLADAFARAGDPSLYELETAEGLLGTEGGPKSLGSTIAGFLGHLDGTHERYATEDEDEVGDVDRLIDGRDEDWISLHDLTLVPANRFHRDERIRAIYLREGLGGYPEDPVSFGPHPPWNGEGGIFPGVLFMFGDLEDEPPPYPPPR